MNNPSFKNKLLRMNSVPPPTTLWKLMVCIIPREIGSEIPFSLIRGIIHSGYGHILPTTTAIKVSSFTPIALAFSSHPLTPTPIAPTSPNLLRDPAFLPEGFCFLKETIRALLQATVVITMGRAGVGFPEAIPTIPGVNGYGYPHSNPTFRRGTPEGHPTIGVTLVVMAMPTAIVKVLVLLNGEGESHFSSSLRISSRNFFFFPSPQKAPFFFLVFLKEGFSLNVLAILDCLVNLI